MSDNNPNSSAQTSENPSHHKPHSFEEELQENHFRVAIFGSARIKPNDEIYKQVFELAKDIGIEDIDVVTGGGPGLMEAANAGHQAGDKDHDAESIGLTIELPFEAEGNKHLELKKHFNKFSNRLDHFMALSTCVVVVPGGIGTCLELFYSWQLIQVEHVRKIPIILIGKMWHELMKWVEENPLTDQLISPEDMGNIFCVDNNQEAMYIIKKYKELFDEEGENYYNQIGKYKLD